MRPPTLRLVVDFSGVEYISSAGLRVMLILAKRVREQRGALALCGLGDSVRHVFDLAGFLPLFAVETRAKRRGRRRDGCMSARVRVAPPAGSPFDRDLDASAVRHRPIRGG